MKTYLSLLHLKYYARHLLLLTTCYSIGIMAFYIFSLTFPHAKQFESVYKLFLHCVSPAHWTLSVIVNITLSATFVAMARLLFIRVESPEKLNPPQTRA